MIMLGKKAALKGPNRLGKRKYQIGKTMGLRRLLRNIARKCGCVVKPVVPKDKLEEFFSDFRKNYVPTQLVRIGGEGDGGYLMPDLLDEVKYCFSPGVDCIAGFEGEISKTYGIKSFMADASVSSAPFEDENFVFIKKFLGSKTEGNFTTLGDWMHDSVGSEQAGMILQMDIEGGEYDVLVLEDAETLAKFSVMLIEFHGLENMFEEHFLQMLSGIFQKLDKNFSISHVHPNNCCGTASLRGFAIPRVIEVTFVRNDVLNKFKSDTPISLPHALDEKNVANKADIDMPKIWWQE